MPIAASDLVAFNAASRPQDDTSPSGGAIDTAAQPTLTQFTANAVLAAVSSGSDTRTLTVKGRLPSGAISTETITLNGTTEVTTNTVWERILTVTLGSASPTLTVTIKQGAGGTVVGTLGPNITSLNALFINSSSDPNTSTTRYEKIFWKNTHATLALTSADVTLTADPDARITIALAATVNDSGSVANRLTSPGLTFSDDNVVLSVPGGSLNPGSAIGVWIAETLPAADSVHRTTFTTRLRGFTT
jgi:hypothetical protein